MRTLGSSRGKVGEEEERKSGAKVVEEDTEDRDRWNSTAMMVAPKGGWDPPLPRPDQRSETFAAAVAELGVAVVVG